MKGHRLPEGWEPTASQIAWAKGRRPDLDVLEQAEMFKDYWHAKAGTGATKLDWAATWRNWIRSARPDPRTSFKITTKVEYTGAKPLYVPEKRERVTDMPESAKDLFARLGIKA